MIVDDAANIWPFHRVNRTVVKPYVHGYVVLPMDVPQVTNIYLDPRRVGATMVHSLTFVKALNEGHDHDVD